MQLTSIDRTHTLDCSVSNPRENSNVVSLFHMIPNWGWLHLLCYWPFVRGIHRSPVNYPHKGQWRGALIFSLVCVWINGWVNNREAGDFRRPLCPLWRQCNGTTGFTSPQYMCQHWADPMKQTFFYDFNECFHQGIFKIVFRVSFKLQNLCTWIRHKCYVFRVFGVFRGIFSSKQLDVWR